MPAQTAKPVARTWRALRPLLLAAALGGAGMAASLADALAADTAATAATADVHSDGTIRIRSQHDVATTVARVKAAVAAKGIRLFDAIDQQALGKEAGLSIPPSTLILFGNPPLGVQFLQANPYAGLDWPVRMLVVEQADGSVWLAWTDFDYIARRYRITNRAAQFRMASEVAASIAAEAAG